MCSASFRSAFRSAPGTFSTQNRYGRGEQSYSSAYYLSKRRRWSFPFSALRFSFFLFRIFLFSFSVSGFFFDSLFFVSIFFILLFCFAFFFLVSHFFILFFCFAFFLRFSFLASIFAPLRARSTCYANMTWGRCNRATALTNGLFSHSK